MATLYRKYRPQNFKEVVGQNHIKITLQHEIESGKIAHAYLFCGPRAVGKTTLARVFSKAINCSNKKEGESEPCNACEICGEITGGRSMDIVEIDAASHTGVDNVRENIIASARVMPSRCKYKVFIIDEVHMLSISAFNALLKIIEEPPAFVVFILCTTEIHKVPTTIISRCQRFDFKRISVNDVIKKLSYIANAEDIKIGKEILEAIARQSEGYMRDAESLLGQIVSVGGREITREEADLVIPRSDLGEAINLIGYLAKKDSANGIRLINKLVDEGVDLKTFAGDLVELLRRILIAKINPALLQKLSLELGESLELSVSQVSRDLTAERLIVMIEKFIAARSKLKDSFIPQLPLELAFIELSADIADAASKPRPAVSVGGAEKNSGPAAEVSRQKPEPAPEASAAASSADIKREQILDKWNEFLAKIKQYNHSLSFIMKVCQPKDLIGGKLNLAFKYKFHKDRVDEPGIKAIIEKVLSQVYNAPLSIVSQIDENLEIAASKPLSQAGAEAAPSGGINDAVKEQGVIDNLLKTFGGKVVN